MKKTFPFLIAIIFVVIICVGYVLNRNAQEAAAITREASKMQELEARLEPELKSYYQQHGAYPKKLQDVPLTNFEWGHEGATFKDLESFSYFSNGQTFIMQWQHADFSYSLCLAGTNGESFFKNQRISH